METEVKVRTLLLMMQLEEEDKEMIFMQMGEVVNASEGAIKYE